MSILFKNCLILTMENGDFKVVDGFLGVNGKYIDYVGETAPDGKYDEEKDMTGRLLMPGLINTHTHAAMTMLRGQGTGKPLDRWLYDCIFPIEDRMGDEDIAAGTELAMLEMVAGGTTSFSDMYMLPWVTAKTVIPSGMKVNICRCVQCFDEVENPETSHFIIQAREFFGDWNGLADGRMLVDYSVHAEYTCKEKTTRVLADMCREHNGNMHVHLAETAKEQAECVARYGKTPARWFADLGAFDCDAFAAHCVAVTKEDIELFRERGVKVVHCPASNMKLGSGFAPIRRFLDAGLTVGLGTDGASSNNDLDMFSEMRLASVIHGGYTGNALELLPADVLKMATVNGAAIQRRNDTGVLAEGKCADIIAVDMTAPHMTPNLDTLGLLVYSAKSSDVTMTMVDGKILYENGEYKTLDKEKILYTARKRAEKIYG